MSVQALTLFTVCLTVGWIHIYGQMRDHFYGPHIYQQTISGLKEEVQREQMLRQLAQFQMSEFKMEVATVLPQAIKGKEDKEEGFPLRTLASIVQVPKEDMVRTEMANVEFKKAANYFEQGQLSQAIPLFREFIQGYSFSIHLPKAMFLLAESYFRLQEFEQCTRTVEKMLKVFPDNELTGYALLRLGKVYEYNDRPEEAIEIYKTVLRSFPYRNLATQSQMSLGAVEL